VRKSRDNEYGGKNQTTDLSVPATPPLQYQSAPRSFRQLADESDMAPVTPDRFQIKQYELVLAFGLIKQGIGPRLPLNGVSLCLSLRPELNR
jgi:hypothetical protein